MRSAFGQWRNRSLLPTWALSGMGGLAESGMTAFEVEIVEILLFAAPRSGNLSALSKPAGMCDQLPGPSGASCALPVGWTLHLLELSADERQSRHNRAQPHRSNWHRDGAHSWVKVKNPEYERRLIQSPRRRVRGGLGEDRSRAPEQCGG